MPYAPEITNFVMEGFKRIGGRANQLEGHRFKKMNYNFFNRSPFKIQTPSYSGEWGASTAKDTLTSSEAFTYNIFSNVKKMSLEYGLRCDIKFSDVYKGRLVNIAWLPNKKTFIDVIIGNEKSFIDMYEVKMFEFTHKTGWKPIFPELSQGFGGLKKLEIESCDSTKKVAKCFKNFIIEVTEYFKYRSVYRDGIRQLCCQLFGITNEMTKYDTLYGKKVRWHALCFDYDFGWEKHIIKLNNYKEALEQMSPMIKKYLKNVNLNDQIEYCGYLGASEFIEKNKRKIGKDNYNYVKNRYFFKSR